MNVLHIRKWGCFFKEHCKDKIFYYKNQLFSKKNKKEPSFQIEFGMTVLLGVFHFYAIVIIELAFEFYLYFTKIRRQ